MSKQHIRIRFNLSEAALGFEALNKELLALPDEKAIRLRIMKILHDYSQSVSGLSISSASGATALKQSPGKNLIVDSQTSEPISTTQVNQELKISNREAMRNAFKANGLEMVSNQTLKPN